MKWPETLLAFGRNGIFSSWTLLHCNRSRGRERRETSRGLGMRNLMLLEQVYYMSITKTYLDTGVAVLLASLSAAVPIAAPKLLLQASQSVK